jgi:hypothetical protein
MIEYPDIVTAELTSGQVWCHDGDNFYVVIQNLDTRLWNAIWLSRSVRAGCLQMYSTIEEWKTDKEMIEWIDDDILVADTGNMWRDLDKWLAKEI